MGGELTRERKMFSDEQNLALHDVREEPLTVSELTAQIKSALSGRFSGVWLRGEISNLRIQGSGHAYFTLKDAGSQISAVAFRGTLARSQARLREGMQLVVFGDIDVYAPRGNYQIIVRILQEEGRGRLQAEYEKLLRKLEAEGLFDKSVKRPIPQAARRIAFVTSPTGAAIRDFISILRRRDWAGTLYVIPSKVQGDGAAEEIVRGIRLAGTLRDLDVLVVGRGGGSLEDLWCFNEEAVARAVRASSVPVISAVGHEIDFTLSDFAADLRAETPSAAAEFISSARMEMADRTATASQSLKRIVDSYLQDFAQRLDLLESRLARRSPEAYLALMRERKNLLAHRLAGAVAPEFLRVRERLGKMRFRFEKQFPKARLDMEKLRLSQLGSRLAATGLEATLKRGFSVAQDEATGALLDSSRKISLGQRVVLRFHDGRTRVEGCELASE